jgi:hypothetical protein
VSDILDNWPQLIAHPLFVSLDTCKYSGGFRRFTSELRFS